MKKYCAIFPLKWGDEARRTYDKKGIAIREAKKHLNACRHFERVFAEVWEVDLVKRTQNLIWEGEK